MERELLIIRHAIAQDRDEAAAGNVNDHDRPLTSKGGSRMDEIAAGLARLYPNLDAIITSPALRARQTAEILASHYPKVALKENTYLAPACRLEALSGWLAGYDKRRIALVGHEPALGILIGSLLCGNRGGRVQMKKGGAALLHFPGTLAVGKGELQWLMTPKSLRMLGQKG